MLRFEGNRDVEFCDGYSRRDFLRAGGLAFGLGLGELAQLEALGAAPRSSELNVIQLFLVGGPSHIDTFDPKPNAPDGIRGPFNSIRTRIPGVRFCEHLPKLAARADRFSLIRSIHHGEAPVHETGHQLLQTGFLSNEGVELPHFGAVVGKLQQTSNDGPSWVLLPRGIGNTGVSVSHGQTAGWLGAKYEACAAEPESAYGLDPARLRTETALVAAVDEAQGGFDRVADSMPEPVQQAATQVFGRAAKRAFDLSREPAAQRERYGFHTFGQSCLLARRLVESGVRLVTVNMFDTVFNRITWDCHANGGDLDTNLNDYRDVLCPMLDQAVAALLDDLSERGLIKNTLVLCLGEFGRTPKLNNRGGRDHWPSCWSGLFAGGPIQPGRVIGASDPHGMAPAERPVHAAEIVATVYHALGIDLRTTLPGPSGERRPIIEAKPVLELF